MVPAGLSFGVLVHVPGFAGHAPSIADMTASATGSEPALVIRDARPDDIAALAAIYDDAVRTSVATFDTEERGAAYLTEKLAATGPGAAFLVAAQGGDLLGYATSGPFRPRPAYAGTTEVSVYLAPSARGQGIATQLYAALLARLDADPAVHTQVAVIALPNEPSERLHTAFGFERVGVLREVGHKFGRYVDTAWWQRLPSAPGRGPATGAD